jgi:hypothetical protein
MPHERVQAWANDLGIQAPVEPAAQSFKARVGTFMHRYTPQRNVAQGAAPSISAWTDAIMYQRDSAIMLVAVKET